MCIRDREYADGLWLSVSLWSGGKGHPLRRAVGGAGPVSYTHLLIAELVGHLASLLMQLNIWRRGLAQERPLEEWLPVCRDMLNAFFLSLIHIDVYKRQAAAH